MLRGHRLEMMREEANGCGRQGRLKADCFLIENGFESYLRERHAAAFTIDRYCTFLLRVAEFLSRRGKSLRELRRRDVPAVLRGCLPGWKAESCQGQRAALHLWLRFQGRYEERLPRAPWQRLLEDYARFMLVHRGLAPCTREHYLRIAGRFLTWQWRQTATDWRRVRPEHIRRFAERCARGYRPKTVGDELSALRQFLRFMHLRGLISPWLPQAVPRVADYGHGRRKEVLTDAQRRQFLAGFERRLPKRHRDYTMALCMLDLGLRGVEISRLRLCDIDWSRRRMTVPPAKRSPGRQLPIPPHVMQALRAYVKSRPESHHDELFVGDKLLIGRPLSPCAVGSAMTRAYRRCGFSRHWHGSHRLRHTFATRLCTRGVDIKQIADLLGHRLVTTTNRYAQVDPRGFRALAQPWPR